jgi:hypothetical protein
MRRAILGVFLLLAACGGAVRSTDAVNRSPQPDGRALRAQFLMTAAARRVIAEFATSASQDALDTCLNAWVEEIRSSSVQRPVSKPDADGLEAFLSECLAGPVPGDLRGVNARAATSADLRISRAGDLRGSYVQ